MMAYQIDYAESRQADDMIFRFSVKLGKKLKCLPTRTLPACENPYADWSAHLFTADRTQYILVTNTVSLYSTVMYGRGISDDGTFLSRAIECIGEVMADDGYQLIRERVFIPDTGSIFIAKALNRSVIGSMNELVLYAQAILTEEEISPYDLSFKLNDFLMSYIDYDRPREAFGKMKANR
jgi:hypothetical protein